MKLSKTIFTSFTMLCLLSTFFLVECIISVKASPTTWTVDDDGAADFRKVQEAINHAKSEDTIFVRKGTYYEHVIVNKSVSLIGEDRDSTIVDGSGIGIVIDISAPVNNVKVQGFTLRNGGSGTGLSDSGILIDHSSGNNISHNTIINNFYGINLQSSSGNVLSDNTVSLSTFIGLSLSFNSFNNVVSGNTIVDNSDGISLFYSFNNVVSGNAISSNNDYGISLYSSSNNVVSGNIIFSNNNYGIYLAFLSNDNIIYYNNFNNTYQVSSDSMNVWDDGNEGNYWSDYTGQDLNRDGIGDNPYDIVDDTQDNHPLMGMFSDFKITLEGKKYHVTTICNSTISEFRFEVGPETGNKIIRFNVTGKESTVGFVRIIVPTDLMNYPYIVLVGAEEIVPTLLDASNETYAYLYFTYYSSQTVTIISSKTLYLYSKLYNELLDKYLKLQMDLHNLNATYYDHLNDYIILLGNYSQLLDSYNELNNSYQELLLDHYENVYNIRNLMYIFAATTAILIITIIYLSRQAHASKSSARTS